MLGRGEFLAKALSREGRANVLSRGTRVGRRTIREGTTGSLAQIISSRHVNGILDAAGEGDYS